MWITVKLRKINIILVLALLFFFITGIILYADRKPAVKAVFFDEINYPMLIIDAGHGGADGGAVASDGSKESLINLKIAEKLHAISAFLGINSLMTREGEELPYPDDRDTIAKMKRWDQQRRLELINTTPNPVFISIHQNKYPDPRPFGPQVLYGRHEKSRILGEGCHELMNQMLCPENRRVATPASDDIYLMKNADCPAILIECGFISNDAELNRLNSGEYQKKLAAVILKAYLDYLDK